MNSGKTVFAQLMSVIPEYEFDKCVSRYNGNHRVRNFTCRDHFYVMCFAQLTKRDSLRDIENCLKAVSGKLYHCGIRHAVPRNTLAKANELRNWRIYADFAGFLVKIARPLYQDDVNILDELYIEPGAIYVVDKGYVDFFRLFNKIIGQKAFFITVAKDNMRFETLSSEPTDMQSGVISDEMIRLTGPKSSMHYPEPIRMVTYEDFATSEVYRFLTNNTALDPLTISELYRERWQVELFFKWIKQHLKIKSFYGTSQNAVYCQIWIALCTYLILAIARKWWKSISLCTHSLEYVALLLLRKYL